jgi:hypothetical protein
MHHAHAMITDRHDHTTDEADPSIIERVARDYHTLHINTYVSG